ncbi:MAG: trypsin-like peptidase domain-containing protein [Bacteriovorax sp.]|nr:trypsin-like peptidase domain-containing protein [Bacteriovorax sp.]
MIKKILISSSIFLAVSSHAGCLEKVVYGDDNRLDVYASPNNLFKKLAISTAAMISSTSLEAQGDTYVIKSGTLEGEGVCSDALFAKQQTAASCSGFLVGSDLLLTAGHCIESMIDCDSYSWVFDYANTTSERRVFNINKKDVYKCTKIIARALDDSTDNDFALVQLDRPTDRSPLSYRKTGEVSECSELVVIGHPSGLPTKISDDAYVRNNSNKYFFQTNLDTFGGNSGSAVFDTKTGLVEGILVRGERDYVLDPKSNCYRPKVCKMDGCRGEDVTRITNIKELKSFK